MKLTPTQFAILVDVLNGRYAPERREARSIRILVARGMLDWLSDPIGRMYIPRRVRITNRGREAIGLPPVRPVLQVIRGGLA